MNEINVFWFRRDLRLFDNRGLHEALKSDLPLLCVFVFDDEILNKLQKNDPRVQFIYELLEVIDNTLKTFGSSIFIERDNTTNFHKNILSKYIVKNLYFNHDYEPYAQQRDEEITLLYQKEKCKVHSFKDQVIFEKNDILKNDGKPYTIYTPFKNKWLLKFNQEVDCIDYDINLTNSKLFQYSNNFPSLQQIGFESNTINVLPFKINSLSNYENERDYPILNSTSHLSPHLRFGTVSTRKMVKMASETNSVFLSELIWREFFMQILYHFPQVVNKSFKPKYDLIQWENNETHFKAWCEGKTGYPIVDAGMRELNETGYMHNRVRMITAGFLCKHLLIDWRWGEAYFAEKLLDFELASNNGNWQWAAGTGCDAAPYFRVFNPTTQQQKFDKKGEYIKKWLPEYNSLNYPQPIVEHSWARNRAIERYKVGLNV